MPNVMKLNDANGQEYVPYKSTTAGELLYPSTFSVSVGDTNTEHTANATFIGKNSSDADSSWREGSLGQQVKLLINKIPGSCIDGIIDPTALPIATTTSLGVVKIGSGILVDSNGSIRSNTSSGLSYSYNSSSNITSTSGTPVISSIDDATQVFQGTKIFSKLNTIGYLTVLRGAGPSGENTSAVHLRSLSNSNWTGVALTKATSPRSHGGHKANQIFYICRGSDTNTYSDIDVGNTNTLDISMITKGGSLSLGYEGNVYIDNDKYYGVKDSEGVVRTVATLSSNNNYIYGGGGGSNSVYIGTTSKTSLINLRSSNGISISNNKSSYNKVSLSVKSGSSTTPPSLKINSGSSLDLAYKSSLFMENSAGLCYNVLVTNTGNKLLIGSNSFDTYLRGAFTEGSFSINVDKSIDTTTNARSGRVNGKKINHGLKTYASGTAKDVAPSRIEIYCDTTVITVVAFPEGTSQISVTASKLPGVQVDNSRTKIVFYWRAWR